MINVLIVDDNICYAVSLMNYINSVNKNVRVCNIADNGKKALKILANENIDITILDLKMPECTGIDVLENLKEKEKYTDSIIVVSGEMNYINNLYKNNMIHSVLYKPIGISRILKEINEILKEKEKNIIERDIKEKIINELLYLNYDLSHKGTIYLADCINYIMSTPSRDFNNLKGEIYPIISKYHLTLYII